MFKQSVLASLVLGLIAGWASPVRADDGFRVAAVADTLATVDTVTDARTGANRINGTIRTTHAGTALITIVPIVDATVAEQPLSATCTAGPQNAGVNAVPTTLAQNAELARDGSFLCARYNGNGLGSSLTVDLLVAFATAQTPVASPVHPIAFSVTASAT